MNEKSQPLTARLLVLAILLISVTGIALAQTLAVESKPENWKAHSSEAGRFSVSFPGTPTVSTEKVPTPAGEFVLSKCMLDTRATYGVIYADYPTKFETDTARKELLVNAAKGAASSIGSELLENTETTVDGNPARLLKERLRSGAIMRAKMVLVDQRLYQAAITLPTPDQMSADEVTVFESAANQFLSSFKITSATAALGEVDQWIKDNGREGLYGTCLEADCGNTEKDAETTHGKVLVLPKPSYPPLARMAKASGTVKVQVIIDEKGDVIAAQAIEGHPLLHAVSVAAAKASRFSTFNSKGQPIKVIGVLQYNFVAQ